MLQMLKTTNTRTHIPLSHNHTNNKRERWIYPDMMRFQKANEQTNKERKKERKKDGKMNEQK